MTGTINCPKCKNTMKMVKARVMIPVGVRLNPRGIRGYICLNPECHELTEPELKKLSQGIE